MGYMHSAYWVDMAVEDKENESALWKAALNRMIEVHGGIQLSANCWGYLKRICGQQYGIYSRKFERGILPETDKQDVTVMPRCCPAKECI
jgi:hypothetical protein